MSACQSIGRCNSSIDFRDHDGSVGSEGCDVQTKGVTCRGLFRKSGVGGAYEQRIRDEHGAVSEISAVRCER